jgi:peptidyl-prolyl cis-trans isomerase SurA
MPRFYRASFYLAAVLAARVFAADAPPALLTPNSPPTATDLPADTVVAVVENRIITFDDLRREVLPRLDAVRKTARNEQDFYRLLDELQYDLLNEQINRALVVYDFQKDGKRRIPASYIDQVVAETILKKYDGDRVKFLAELRNNGWSQRDYRKRVEEDLIYDIMRGQQRKSETVISPTRVAAYYNENKDKFLQEDEVHFRLITLTRAAGENDASLLARVQPVLARLKSGEKFDALAREFSNDEIRRAKGGDFGWTKKTDLKPEFAAPAFTQEKGEPSGPIITPEACYLLYVEDRKAAGIKPLAEVSGDIQKELAAQLGREAEARWIARLRATAYIRVYLPPPGASAPASSSR